MPTNASPEYIKAEKKYLEAVKDEERLEWLEEMIRYSPSHKGGENLRAQLRLRLKKLKEKLEKGKAKKKGSKIGIKKEDLQAVLIGYTNSGKSSLMHELTNATPEIASYDFTTKKPVIGTLVYENIPVQIIENPALGSEYFDRGLANNADTLLIVVTNIEEISEIIDRLPKAEGKKIVIYNKSDFLDDNEKRKLKATLQSKKYDFVMVSCRNHEGIEELRKKILNSFNKMRIYTKHPEKQEKESRPVIMPPGATVKDVAEKILHGFSKNVISIRIWGPSSKFGGQKVGLNHKLKSLDVVEFRTK
jgi:hypothetical protein